MIRIRYTDLPAGVHVRTTIQGRHTVVFLLHGLTPAQRKAALRRARGAAQVGQGPPLPRAALARALAADRLRATIRNGFGAMRMHPAIFFPPLVIVLSAAVAYLLLVSVTIRFGPGPQVHGPDGPVVGAAAPVSAVPLPPSPGHQSVPPPVAPGSPAPTPSPSTVRPTTRVSPPPFKTPPPPQSSPASPPDPTPGPSSSSSPAPSPLPSHKPSPSPAPTPSPSPSPTSSGGGNLCVKVGPLGVCLSGL